MKWLIFKTPIKPGDQPVETLTFEPTEFLIQQKALKYQSIQILSEEDWEKQKQDESI